MNMFRPAIRPRSDVLSQTPSGELEALSTLSSKGTWITIGPTLRRHTDAPKPWRRIVARKISVETKVGKGPTPAQTREPALIATATAETIKMMPRIAVTASKAAEFPTSPAA